MRWLPLLLICCVAPVAWAQATEEEVVVLTEDDLLPALSLEPLTADEALRTLRDRLQLDAAERQLLDGFSLGLQRNLVLVRQEGDGNLAVVEQLGEANLAALLQFGVGNAVVAEQIGRGNLLGVQITGDGNRLGAEGAPGVLQFGDGNLYLLEYTGSGRDLPAARQLGDGNQLVQTGVTALPFAVEQRGGAVLIIRHDP